MRLLIFGGTGLIGRALADELTAEGSEVWIVTRRTFGEAGGGPGIGSSGSGAPGPRFVSWDAWEADPSRWEGFDAIVNLAGETINQRWTKAAKARIMGSRVQAAEKIAAVMGRMSSPPPVVVNASAISVYGHSEGTGVLLDESSPPQPSDFLGDTIVRWEEAADRIPARRLVKLRIGVVLSRRGGAFPLLRLPYLLFAGGRLGSGRQGMPWIHLADVTGLIRLSLTHPEISGPLNAVAPDPVTNDEFGRRLARVMGRPHWFHIPAPLIRLALGEMSTLLLTGPAAYPRKALEHGYTFKFPRLEDALRDLLA